MHIRQFQLGGGITMEKVSFSRVFNLHHALTVRVMFLHHDIALDEEHLPLYIQSEIVSLNKAVHNFFLQLHIKKTNATPYFVQFRKRLS